MGFDLFDMPKTLGFPWPTGDIQLVLQDVLTLHGSQFRDAAVIVASPPCQAYSYRAMPWNPNWRDYSRWDDDGGPAANHRVPDVICNDLGNYPATARSIMSM